MKQKVIRQSHEICIERAILITESYRKTKRDFPVIRFAKAIKHILQNMTIKICLSSSDKKSGWTERES